MLPTIATGNVASALAGEYEVANSLRLNDGSSDFLHRMKSNSDEITTMTFSCWVKRCSFGSTQRIFSHMTASFVNYFYFRFENDDKLAFASENTGGYDTNYKTNRVFRDASAWYHLVARIDTTASGGNRIRIYVNGEQETSLLASTEPDQNSTFSIGTTSDPMVIGGLYGSTYGIGSGSSSEHFDGYIAEAVMCEGQSLDPTSFGEFDSDTNIWKPIDVSGLTFGTNGFYLDFENASSLGADVSGNSNNFTVNNLTSVDQSTDTCTNNFCTLNPLIGSNHITLSEGNLRASTTTSSWASESSTFSLSQGKWYLEVYVVGYNHNALGVQFAENSSNRASGYPFEIAGGFGFKFYGGHATSQANDSASYGNQANNGDTVGMALDLDNHKIYFSINGTFQNSGVPTSGSTGTGSAHNLTTGKDYVIVNALNHQSGNAISSFNFGSPPHSISSGNSDANGFGNFEYPVPSGYFSINTKNLAEYG